MEEGLESFSAPLLLISFLVPAVRQMYEQFGISALQFDIVDVADNSDTGVTINIKESKKKREGFKRLGSNGLGYQQYQGCAHEWVLLLIASAFCIKPPVPATFSRSTVYTTRPASINAHSTNANVSNFSVIIK